MCVYEAVVFVKASMFSTEDMKTVNQLGIQLRSHSNSLLIN